MKQLILSIFFILSISSSAQVKNGAQEFWTNLKKHCGKSFEGEVIEAPENDSFRGQKLIMHVKQCSENIIKIPFFVGNDRSRTWVLTYQNERIQLKHDHRHEDGSPDNVTMYGGTSSNSGLAEIQFFPADQETANLIGYASTNVWWITLNDTSFTYNLRRIGTDRLFSVSFDITKPTETPADPWGWNIN
ncbi:MAG: hypothetical protein KGZ87_07285 [Bacteroidetes bacterium]|jgi:hypothetical protein|nr:hypothetical protein [Bacteroidota bacterium]